MYFMSERRIWIKCLITTHKHHRKCVHKSHSANVIALARKLQSVSFVKKTSNRIINLILQVIGPKTRLTTTITTCKHYRKLIKVSQSTILIEMAMHLISFKII